MAGDWIPIRLNLHEDPAVFLIADQTGLDPFGVVGRLVRVWSWANAHLADGHAPGVTKTGLDAVAGAPGFADAMAAAGWLHTTGSGIVFARFEEWNSQGAKRRILAARRKRSQRVPPASRSGRDKSVTREEKRREEDKGRKPPKPPAAAVVGDLAPIPPTLDTPDFRAVWLRWVGYRVEIRKRLTPTTAAAQLAALAPIGPAAAVECVNASIRNGWQGLFPEKHGPRAGGGPAGKGEALDGYALDIFPPQPRDDG
jgi:hypothetical protein